jgi:DNA-binding NarL/FixJ family response regulator
VEEQIEVMVVDDEPDIRFMLRMYIGRLPGFEITREAANGEQAVEMVQARCPEAVVLDIGMPVMDGIEATYHIRNACPRTKIIVFSAYPAEKLKQEALARGADLCLSKNTPPREVAEAIRELCA